MAQEANQGIVRLGETPAELERYNADQLAEYLDWVAAQDIYAGTALAFPKGYPVPTSTVEAQGYDKNGLVEPSPQALAKLGKAVNRPAPALADPSKGEGK